MKQCNMNSTLASIISHRTVSPILLGTVGWDGHMGFHRTVLPILLGTVGWDGLIGFHRTVTPILRGEWTVLCGQWILMADLDMSGKWRRYGRGGEGMVGVEVW